MEFWSWWLISPWSCLGKQTTIVRRVSRHVLQLPVFDEFMSGDKSIRFYVRPYAKSLCDRATQPGSGIALPSCRRCFGDPGKTKKRTPLF